MWRFIAQKRYVKLMFSLNGKNISQLSKEVDMTLSHISNVMDQFSKEGIIEKEKKGREIEIKVTEKGQELIEILRKYDEIANRKIEEVEEKSKSNQDQEIKSEEVK